MAPHLWRFAVLALGVVVAAATTSTPGLGADRRHVASGARPKDQQPPNFVLFLLDDLDQTQGSSTADYMPAMHRLLASQGVTFENYFVTTPICCPSRVNLLKGQLSHNTNFTDVLGPHGGYKKFRELRLDQSYLPVWLQRIGYSTYYTGKFIVDYTILNCNATPAGWTDFDALVMPFTFEYHLPAFSRNGATPVHYPGQYNTDVVASKAVAQVRSAAASGAPFYLQVAPPAPHHSMHYTYNDTGDLLSRKWYPPLPAARHFDQHTDALLPRRRSWNEDDVSDKPAWVQALDRLTRGNITFLEEVHRLRLRSLMAVDELVEAVVSELEAQGLLDNTYLIFTSDNGYHEGIHRMGNGKTTAYDEDIHVPFHIKGPGLKPGAAAAEIGMHIDVAPTVLALAGAPLPSELDGLPLPLAQYSDGGLPLSYPGSGFGTGTGAAQPAGRNQLSATGDSNGNGDGGPAAASLSQRRHGAGLWGLSLERMLAEFWGSWDDESIRIRPPYTNLTWKAVRAARLDQAAIYKYVLHCSGEHELYDLVADPGELYNLLAGGAEAAPQGGHQRSGTRRRATQITLDNLVAMAAQSSSSSTAEQRNGVLCGLQQRLDSWWRRLAGWAHALPLPRRCPVGVAGTSGRRLARLRSRLDALLAVLAVCRGGTCAEPWRVLHPDGSVVDLWAALDPRYDDMYDTLPPFEFRRCLNYQDIDNEVSPFREAVAEHVQRAAAAAAAAGGTAHDERGAATEGAASEEQATGWRWRRGGGTDKEQQRQPVTIPADVEQYACALPAKYHLVKDVFGAEAVRDALLLA